MPKPSIAWVDNALVEPCSGQKRSRDGWIMDGGVFDAEGALVPLARHRGDRTVEAAPVPLRRDDLPVTPGAHLFGGWLHGHFGHFMAYGVGRLWAVPELAGKLSSVVFLQLAGRSRKPARDQGLSTPLRDVLACLGVGPTLPWRILQAPERFERLAVPEQVILAGGAAQAQNQVFVGMLRAMQHSPLVRHGLVVPRLYVSRSRLPGHLGGLLFEDLLEENLIAEGYAIMYPEQLPIAEQVAVYASARQFIFAEGSSLHLGVGFIGADCPVAVVCRRPPRNPRPGYLLAAGLRRGAMVDAVAGGVVTLQNGEVTEHATVLALALLDFERLRTQLVAAGLCHGRDWRMPTEAEVAARIDQAIVQRQQEMPTGKACFVSRDELMQARLRSVYAAKPAAAPPATATTTTTTATTTT